MLVIDPLHHLVLTTYLLMTSLLLLFVSSLVQRYLYNIVADFENRHRGIIHV